VQTDLQGGESPPEAVPDLRSKECFPEAVPHLRGKASITTVATGAPASRGPGSTCQLRACRAAVESSNKHCYVCLLCISYLLHKKMNLSFRQLISASGRPRYILIILPEL
jgi:hypothetical protein